MEGWLIYSKKDASENESYIKWFQLEAEKQHIHLQLVFRESLTIGIVDGTYTVQLNGDNIALPDFAVIRTIEPLVQHVFEACSVPTFNTRHVSKIANHKAWAHIELQKLGIPMLPTLFLTKRSFPTDAPISFPFVVKEATGRGGKQVYFVEDEKAWELVKQNISDTDLIIQSSEVQLGKDLRVFVIGKEIIAAVMRRNDDDFRANFKLGGDAIPYQLSKEQKEIIRKIITHFDFGLVGIDFLLNHNDELIFNEIEDVVGSRILSKTSDINLLERYVAFIKKSVLQHP